MNKQVICQGKAAETFTDLKKGKTDRGENKWRKSNKRSSSTEEANFILNWEKDKKLTHNNK